MRVTDVIAFDTETHLIEPGLLAPPLVCLQWLPSGPYQSAMLIHRDAPGTVPLIKGWLDSDKILVGHNVAYDMAVIAAQWPELLPVIFAKYARNQVTDTLTREQLLMLSRGQFRSFSRPLPDGGVEMIGVKYSLADCITRHFGRQLKKEGWRLFYRVFDQEPNIDAWLPAAKDFQANAREGHWPQWALDLTSPEDRAGLLAASPEEAVTYALEDARTTLALYEHQELVALDIPGVFADQFRRARASFALHLSSAWGLHTDADAVEELAEKLEVRFAELTADLQHEGIIRDDGSADTKAAMAAMVEACREEGLPVAMTRGGTKPRANGQVSPPQVSLGAEACERFDEDTVIGMYSTFQTLRKTLRNDIKMLRAGVEVPIQPRYDMADTGRTRCSKPNIQAINRGEGIRDCFRPRPGYVFIQGDFEGLELHTLAQWCLTVLGKSELAKRLNAGIDVHLDMAATMLGITYGEALAMKKAGSPAIKEYRQQAKAVNFGYPGGLGAKKLVRYAKSNYGTVMSLQDAEAAKHAWLSKLPEMVDFFRLAAQATAQDTLATETHIFSGRIRGGCRYSALCNGRFQGLGADAALEAMWRVTEACYVLAASPLYGCRPVAFVHDEIIAECPDAADRVDAAARELGRLMCEGANVYLKDVPVRVLPQAMTKWSKKAEPTFDSQGRIIPWTGEPVNTV